MKRTYAAAIAVALVLMALAAGCATSADPAGSARRPAGGENTPSTTAQARFVGYKWLVTAITSHGKRTPIPRADQHGNQVYVLFTPNGQFGANDPINIYEGTYRQVGDGFTTSGLMGSAVGYAGDNQVIILAIDAISALGNGAHAEATVTGNRLVISVGGFVLDCQRDGASGSSFF
jgi:hypothetical protein